MDDVPKIETQMQKVHLKLNCQVQHNLFHEIEQRLQDGLDLLLKQQSHQTTKMIPPLPRLRMLGIITLLSSPSPTEYIMVMILGWRRQFMNGITVVPIMMRGNLYPLISFNQRREYHKPPSNTIYIEKNPRGIRLALALAKNPSFPNTILN